MKYSELLQEQAIAYACKQNGLDCHIIGYEFKKYIKQGTWADRLYERWHSKNKPIKRTYMFCNTLDMDFFFSDDGKAMFTYAGYSYSDKECDSLIKAFKVAKKFIKDMNYYVSTELEKGE